MQIVPLTADHGRRIELPPENAAQLAQVRSAAYIEELLEVGPAYAVVDGETVIALGGIADHGGGRGVGWCYLSVHAKRAKLSLVRIGRRVLAACGLRRVEIVTYAGWEKATRLALALRFEYEGDSRGYFEDGHDAHRWGRV